MAAACNARAEPLEEEKELREEEEEESLFAFPLQDDLEQELIRGRAVCGRCRSESVKKLSALKFIFVVQEAFNCLHLFLFSGKTCFNSNQSHYLAALQRS